jgi:putative membrane protein
VGHDEVMEPSSPADGAPEPSRDDTGDGQAPDVRFSFANERTFLAWQRTALGLMTAGLAITQLLPSFDFPGGRRLIGLPLIALGIVIASLSYWEWRLNEQAMRHDQPLPDSHLPLLVAIVVAVVAMVGFVLVIVAGGGS